MAGIALVKGAVDGIKSIINTANDVSDIAGYVDKLFEGEKQVQQKRNKKSGIDNFGGIGGVASEVIDARLAKEAKANGEDTEDGDGQAVDRNQLLMEILGRNNQEK
mgnify:CR=1 FL=1